MLQAAPGASQSCFAGCPPSDIHSTRAPGPYTRPWVKHAKASTHKRSKQQCISSERTWAYTRLWMTLREVGVGRDHSYACHTALREDQKQ